MSVRLEKCHLACTVCQRRCNDAEHPGQSHRFDCCGVIEAHDWLRPDRHKPVDERRNPPRWVRISNPMARGYLTGPSRTEPKGVGAR